MQLLTSKLQWYLTRLFERLGWVGNVALALIAFLFIAYWLWLRPLQHDVSALKVAATTSPQVQDKQLTKREQLNAFLVHLPSVNEREVALQKVMDIANQAQIFIDEAKYKTKMNVNDEVRHYHVEFSVYERYAKVQHFLSELLSQLNYVSIKSLTFSREDVSDSKLEVRMHLVLHFKP